MPRTTTTAARKQAIQDEQRRKLIDEYGALDVELRPAKSKLRRLEELGRLIRSWQNDAPPEETVTIAGDAFAVVIGPRGLQTHLASAAELYRVMGRARFLAAATITLKALEATVDPSIVASLQHQERTGNRTLLPVRRGDDEQALNAEPNQ